MPGFDGTGPNGMGPMTGGGRGFCTMPVNRMDGFAGGRRMFGRGFGGRGRGFRHCFYATGLPGWARAGFGRFFGQGNSSAADETEVLKAESEALKSRMEAIQGRIDELKAQEKK